ncbi:MAG: hypothetical protein WD577_07845 [Bacteroidales bacterium]
MNEKAFIELCLNKIEEQLDWKPSEEWKDYDFKFLQKEIYSSTGVSISTHTLKRLFGKISYSSEYAPQHATKDALAVYIGFTSWEDFVKQCSNENNEKSLKNIHSEPKALTEKKTRRKGIYFTYIILVLLVIASAVTLIKFSFQNSAATFNVINREGYIPHTVTFELDISSVRSKQVFVDFDFMHPVDGEYLLVDPEQKLINHTYQVPNIYYPKLLVENKVVATDIVVVKSNGWVVFYNPPGEPEYWMNNMFQYPEYDDYMTFTRQDIGRHKLDTLDTYYTDHRNVKNFGLSGDNFKFEMKFKNGLQNGGISCFNSRLSIICEQQQILIAMVEPNCYQYCGLKYGGNDYEGRYSDLSFLARDMSDWIVMRVEVVDKNFSIYMENEKTYEGSYKPAAGDIKGLQIRFKGSGMVDYMLMTSVDNDTVYYDDFIYN